MKSVLTITIAACIAMVSFGCGGGSTNTNAVTNTNTSVNSNSNAKPANMTTASTATNSNVGTTSTAPSNTETAKTQPAGDTIGVPECDDYIKKYDACLAKIALKSPKAASSMKASFEVFTDRWKKSANTPEGKVSVANACKAALEEAESNPALSSYACAW